MKYIVPIGLENLSDEERVETAVQLTGKYLYWNFRIDEPPIGKIDEVVFNADGSHSIIYTMDKAGDEIVLQALDKGYIKDLELGCRYDFDDETGVPIIRVVSLIFSLTPITAIKKKEPVSIEFDWDDGVDKVVLSDDLEIFYKYYGRMGSDPGCNSVCLNKKNAIIMASAILDYYKEV